METITTNGITISVEAFYMENESQPGQRKHIFSYHVTIENVSNDTVQLLRRHWYIIESSGNLREVKGDGVIGQQPTLAPGESHSYKSWAQITADFGKMLGTYHMISPLTNKEFEVQIPAFKLIAKHRLN